MKTNGRIEISRSNAISNQALTYLKAVNVSLRIKEMAGKLEINEKSIIKELGIENEK